MPSAMKSGLADWLLFGLYVKSWRRAAFFTTDRENGIPVSNCLVGP